jgi:hypothetical protein
MVLFGPGAPGGLPTVISRPHMRPIQLAASPYSCDATIACVAFSNGRQVSPQGVFASALDDKLLELVGDQSVIVDPVTGHTTSIPGRSLQVSWPSGSMVTIGSYVLDLSRWRVLGRLPSQARAVDLRGRGLVLDDDANKRGPLRWVEPQQE